MDYSLPLVSKGGVVAFDELAQKKWEGETVAFKECLDANKIRLRRFNLSHTFLILLLAISSRIVKKTFNLFHSHLYY